jgi:hypothetical protein
VMGGPAGRKRRMLHAIRVAQIKQQLHLARWQMPLAREFNLALYPQISKQERAELRMWSAGGYLPCAEVRIATGDLWTGRASREVWRQEVQLRNQRSELA